MGGSSNKISHDILCNFL